MDKRKVAWITFNAFIDTDLYIVRELVRFYDIDWYIIKSGNDRYEFVDEIETLKSNPSLKISMQQCGSRLRSPSCISFYRKLLAEISKSEPDVIYTSLAGAPYYIPILASSKDKDRVILAIHNVHVPKGGSAYWFFKFYNSLAVKSFRYYQTFSTDQYQLLKSMIPDKKVFYAPFILKDYGLPRTKRTDSRITFLNFGNIRAYKRIDVLIEAVQRVYENTKVSMRVILAGKCEDWENYAKLIRYPELFDLRIHRIDNNDIPDLFAEADYYVAPYQDIAQSGSSVVAVNYGIPLIASRLPAFEEYVEDKVTGRLIEPANVDSLATVIRDIVESNNAGYDEMVDHLIQKREELFSTESVVKRYREFIDGIIEGKASSSTCR